MILALMLMVTTFKDDQLKMERVRGAQKHTDASLRERFAKQGLDYPPKQIFLRAFKRDKQLEVWVPGKGSLALFHTYDICASSGDLGPKWESGDGQVPEGVYTIDHFNPTSNYHLSLRVSYPNAADRARTAARAKAANEKTPNMGGDIYVHGNCVTIGCMPLTDAKIEEVYWLAVQVGSPIAVHIFPTRLTEEGMKDLQTRRVPEATMALWRQLQVIYARFETTHVVPRVRVDGNGYKLSQ